MSVEIFADANFSGEKSGPLNTDFSDIGSFWNDRISSIKVYSGTWQFFEHSNYQGKSYVYKPGDYPGIPSETNDTISSFKRVG